MAVRSGSTWAIQATPADFGWGVALSGDGNTAIFGEEPQPGVYVRTGTLWTRLERLPVATNEERSYVAISADGHAAIVGGRFAEPWSFFEYIAPGAPGSQV